MIQKIELNGHPSVAIAYCEEEKKFLLLVYDKSFDLPAYRGSANVIGGNPKKTDKNPKDTLIREISEEFNPNHPEKHKFRGEVTWADDEDIRLIRNNILGKIEPYHDFYVIEKGILKKNKLSTAIFSCFYVSVSVETIECVEKNIKAKKTISSEGPLRVFTLNKLENHPKGRNGTAHATAPIINHKFGSNILWPKATISCELIGEVKKSYKDYRDDYIYGKKAFNL